MRSMTMRPHTLAAALLLGSPSLALVPAAAQDAGRSGADALSPSDDCAFLTKAFAETYRGLRQEEGKLDKADPAQVIMYLGIQSNTLQLADSAGCDVSPMIDIVRRELRRYDNSARGGRRGGDERAPRDGGGQERP